MPSLSPTMTKGSIVKWMVEEGTAVASGETIAEIETDKATLDFEVVDEGIVAKLLVKAGTKDIEVGEPIAVFVDEANHVEKFQNYQSKESQESSGAAEGVAQKPHVDTQEYKIGPAARKLASENHLPLHEIQARGPRSVITKGDIIKAISMDRANPKTAPKSTEVHKPSKQSPKKEAKPLQEKAQFQDVPVSQRRRVIAERLLHSKKTIPSIYCTLDCKIDQINRLRALLKEQKQKVSVNDFIVKAVSLTLRDVPQANARWDGENNTVKPLPSVDISIAVATDNGLITPIVKEADTKSLKVINGEILQLAQKGREGRLKLEEFQGGTFAISNLGMYGIQQFSAIINPPQSGILAVGGIKSDLQLDEGSNVVKTNSKISLTLTGDNRIFDDEVSNSFLNTLRQYVENPLPLLV